MADAATPARLSPDRLRDLRAIDELQVSRKITTRGGRPAASLVCGDAAGTVRPPPAPAGRSPSVERLTWEEVKPAISTSLHAKVPYAAYMVVERTIITV